MAANKTDPSYYCSLCNHLFYVPKINNQHLKSAPKCNVCGGPGIETKLSAQKHKTRPLIGTHPHSCPHCSKPFRSDIARDIHIEENHTPVTKPSHPLFSI